MSARILVVEDEGEIRENLVEVLASEGYVVEQAENLTDALRIIFEKKFHLIISDIALVHQDDGLILLERVRRDKTTKNTPVILLTARSAREDVRQGMNLGAQDYITKPFTRVELLASVEARLKQVKSVSEKKNNTQYFVSVITPAHPEGELVELQDITLVGRSPICLVHLTDRAISRYHCTFQKKRDNENPGYYLVDGPIGKTPQPSGYGVWINGIKIQEIIELRGGEKIQIAPDIFLEYKIRKSDDSDTTSDTEL